jgi:hypothetical protein
MNYELVWQATITSILVPTVLRSPHLTPVRTVEVKPPSIQVPPKHTQQTLKNSFLLIFQIMQPNIMSLGPQPPTRIKTVDVRSKPYLNVNHLNQNTCKKKKYGK